MPLITAQHEMGTAGTGAAPDLDPYLHRTPLKLKPSFKKVAASMKQKTLNTCAYQGQRVIRKLETHEEQSDEDDEQDP